MLKNLKNNKIDDEVRFTLLLEKGSKFIQIIINAISQKRHKPYDFFVENDNNEDSKNNINIPNEIIEILRKYYKTLQKNIEKYKERKLQNNLFKKGYSYYKQFNKRIFSSDYEEPHILFRDLFIQYKNKKHLSFSNEFLKKNIFKSSPLLLISQYDLIQYFSVDKIQKNFNYLGQKKSIWFLKRIIDDLQNLIEKSRCIEYHDFKSFSVIYNKNKNLKSKEAESYKLLKKIKNKNDIENSKKEISCLNNLIKIEENNQKEKDKKYYNNISQNNTIDMNQSDIISNLPSLKIKESILPEKKYNKTIKKSFKRKIKNQTESTIFSKLNSSQSSMNFEESIFENKNSISNYNNISINNNNISVNNNNISVNNNNSTFINNNNIDTNDLYSQKRSRIKKIKIKIKKSNSDDCFNNNNEIENVYDNLKKYKFILGDNKGNKKINPLLSFYYGENKVNNFNPKNNTSEIFEKFSFLKDKVSKVNLNEKMKTLYPQKFPNKLIPKLEDCKILDNQIKELNLKFIRSIIKQKIKNKEELK